MMESSFRARGVIVPLLTPLSDGGKRINEEALAAHLQWLSARGVFGVMPCGTTGEGPLLKLAERKYLLEQVMNVVSGQIVVMPHIGGIITSETIELASHAQRLGVDAISVVTPYFYRLSDFALVQYYQTVANSVAEMPVFLYNIPQNTGNSLTQSVIAEILEQSPNVVGIKDSSGDLANLAGYIGLRDGGFQVICGSDGLLLNALGKGVVASVSGNANIFPEIIVKLVAAFRTGDLGLAEKQQKKLDVIRSLLEDGGNISLMKRILERRGLKCGNVRSPLSEVSDQKVTEVERQLKKYNLL
jgi:4-hydroxy-tetrahydrodipicolinate synthase